MDIKDTRPYKAGLALAGSIIELVNLMYQNETAEKFFTALYNELLKEMKHRGIKVKEL